MTGAVLGFVGGTLSFRYGWFQVPGERPLQRMSRQLRLTPDQRKQMDEIVEDTKKQVMRGRREYELKRHKLMLEAYLRIVGILSPEQRARFDRKFVPPALQLEARRLAPSPAPTSSISPLAAPHPPSRY